MLKVVDLLFPIGALVVIDDGVGGDAEEPSGKGSAAPFVARQVGERFVKYLGGEVFGRGAVVDAADEEEVDTIEMKFIERVEFRRVALSGFDQ